MDLPRPLLEAWYRHDSDSRAARHEAGHCIATLHTPGRAGIDRVTITPRAELLEAGLGGAVYHLGGAEETAASIHERFRLPQREAALEELRAEHGHLLRRFGAYHLAGGAAEFPRAVGVRTEAWTSTLGDRIALSRLLAIGGVHYDARGWPWPAWEGACALVDARWGEVLAIASVLLARKTLTGAEVVEIAAAAPEIVNHRPPWR